ncbi:fatty acid-binding protein-like [Oppia nitens]|uniref:fatty acid-binding protein-like n=1 Tax=Oppia nitens TaxID=1686743 RepID=UPI0023DC9C62|nr:fatty acid-binding protein-like [Oppia nitens]
MTDFTGKFKLTSSDNFDEFLKELGVNFVLRNLAKTSTPVVEISKDGDTYSLKTLTAIKNSEIKFELGKEFEEARMDGKNIKTVVVADGNKLIQTQYGDKEVKIVREFTGPELVVTATVGSVSSVRKYARQ